MPQNKDLVYCKQVFGRDCSSVIGYCDKTLEFITGNSKEENLVFPVTPEICIRGIKQIDKEECILSDILDVLQISPREMLKHWAASEETIKNIVEFFGAYAKKNYILCNIVIPKISYVQKKSTDMNSEMTQAVTNILYGHQIFFVIPYHKEIKRKTIEDYLTNNMSRLDAYYFEKPLRYFAKINFDPIKEIPQAEHQTMISTVTGRKDTIPILIELDKIPQSYPTSDVSVLAFRNTGYLTKAIDTIKTLSPSSLESIEEEHGYDKLFELLTDCSKKISEHEKELKEGPVYSADRFHRIHSDIWKFYNLFLQYLKKSFKYNLPVAFIENHDFSNISRMIRLFSLRKLYNKFILELNHLNYAEAMDRLQNFETIIVSPSNIGYLIDAYSDKERIFQWLLDTMPEPSEHPVIIKKSLPTGQEKHYVLGKARQNKPGKFCNCKHCSNVRYWICEDCGAVMEIKDKKLQKSCSCQDTSFKNIEFFCYSQWKHANDKSTTQASTSLASTSPKSTLSNNSLLAKLCPSSNSTSSNANSSTPPKRRAPNPPPKPINKGSKIYNILFIGGSGTGKSTLINSIPNYQKFPRFEDAKTKLDIIMPAVFTFYSKAEDGKMQTHKIEVGNPDENENFNDKGQSTTQKPKQYSFEFEGNKFNIIDTPGLMDSRGHEQDKENLNFIREEIIKLDGLHGICIVLKSNESKLGPELESCLRELLSLFPKTAVSNLFYIFTHCGGTFGGVGDATKPLKVFAEKFHQTNNAHLEFTQNRITCIENEAFHYLIAVQNNVSNYKKSATHLEETWQESAQNIKDFFKEITTVNPIPGSEIKNTYLLGSIAGKLAMMVAKKKSTIPNEASITILNEAIGKTMVMNCSSLKTLVDNLVKKSDDSDPMDLDQALKLLADVPELKEEINELIEGGETENGNTKLCKEIDTRRSTN